MQQQQTRFGPRQHLLRVSRQGTAADPPAAASVRSAAGEAAEAQNGVDQTGKRIPELRRRSNIAFVAVVIDDDFDGVAWDRHPQDVHLRAQRVHVECPRPVLREHLQQESNGQIRRLLRGELLPLFQPRCSGCKRRGVYRWFLHSHCCRRQPRCARRNRLPGVVRHSMAREAGADDHRRSTIEGRVWAIPRLLRACDASDGLLCRQAALGPRGEDGQPRSGEGVQWLATQTGGQPHTLDLASSNE